MESTLSTLVLGIVLGLVVLNNVECQQNVNPFSPPPPPPPPPLSPPPPPQPFSPPPPLLQSSPPPPSNPPPRRRLRPPPPPLDHGIHSHRGPHGASSPPPPKKEKLNAGKIVGLMFIGVAVILQVCVAAFLLVKRRQLLLNAENAY